VVAPTGRQLTIARDEQRAVVVEVGAGIREYVWGGRVLLDGYREDEMPSGRRGLPLLPWPNRIADGRYTFDGADHQLPITQVAEHNAIHGLTSFVAWDAQEDASAVVFTTVVHPQPGYPFTLELAVVYELGEDGLVVTISARNAGEQRLPFGAGHHPYLQPGSPVVDGTQLTLPAATVLDADHRGIPTGRRPVEGSQLDFRSRHSVGGARLDHCFTDLERDPDGLARVFFGDAELWLDSSYPYVMVYSGDTLAEPLRRKGLAIEPMSCPPNAFQSGEALVVLEPNKGWRGRWGLKLRRP
jgi:aldose 1-epimerase